MGRDAESRQSVGRIHRWRARRALRLRLDIASRERVVASDRTGRNRDATALFSEVSLCAANDAVTDHRSSPRAETAEAQHGRLRRVREPVIPVL